MKKHSLTRQVTFIVSILVAGAILLCWVLNTTLLPRYYIHNKKQVLMENYETISNASEQDKLKSDEFTVTFDNLCSNGNIMTLILQPDGKVLRSSVNDLDTLRGELWNVLLHTDDMEVLYSNDQYQLLRKNDTRLDSEYLVLDCAQDSTWVMTVGDGFYNSIDQVYQYYNPDAPVPRWKVSGKARLFPTDSCCLQERQQLYQACLWHFLQQGILQNHCSS